MAPAPPDEIQKIDEVLTEMKTKLVSQLENPHLDKTDLDLLERKLKILSSVS